MPDYRGYYSLVQICPDRARMETANLGVALYCPEAGFLDVTLTTNHRRAKAVFQRGRLDLTRLKDAKKSLKARLLAEGEWFRSEKDFEAFTGACANDIIMTRPRPLKTQDPDVELRTLFDELVDGPASMEQVPQTAPAAVHLPELDQVFAKLVVMKRARLDIKIRVPYLGREIAVPYAYRNGAVKLVVPSVFPVKERSSAAKAMPLAAEGRLLKKHDDANLVVVGQFKALNPPTEALPADLRTLEENLASLFETFGVEFVRPSGLREFAKRVEAEAR